MTHGNNSPNILVSIGNSDDKLSQEKWHNFINEVRGLIVNMPDTVVHGQWFSLPDSKWQNANFCFQIQVPKQVVEGMEGIVWSYENSRRNIRNALHRLCAKYKQDSIAWTEGPVEFLGPKEEV